jgi:putative selenate reductase
LPPYFHELQKEMQKVGAGTIDEFILDYRGQRAAAGGDPVQAGYLNTPLVVAETQADRRYHSSQNSAVPKRIDSHLVTFDCITCDKCIPVCPNDANFTYRTGVVRVQYRNIKITPNGSVTPTGERLEFVLEKTDQIANFADYCNHCGNCDTFCPEYDGPYLKKPNFYGSRAAFEAGAPFDGFLVERSADRLTLTGRIDGRIHTYERGTNGHGDSYSDSVVQIRISSDGDLRLAPQSSRPQSTHVVDVGRLHAFATLLRGITNDVRVHAVNTPLLSATNNGDAG